MCKCRGPGAQVCTCVGAGASVPDPGVLGVDVVARDEGMGAEWVGVRLGQGKI